MAYTNSSLVSYTKLSPNHSGQRTHSIDRITPHCVVSNAKRCADSNPGYSVFDDNGVNIYSPGGAASAPSEDVPFLVQVSISDLNIRKGPGTDYAKTGKFTGKGVFTIMEVKSGQGSTAGWGRLKSGAGWISLDYTSKIK